MADKVRYDLCPETGIGCVMIDQLKIDLMPDEAAELRELVRSGDMSGAKTLLAGVDAGALTAVDDACLEELATQIH